MTTGLTPYTNTYRDVDDAVADSADLIAEYHRVAEFLNSWSGNINQLTPRVRNRQFVYLSTVNVNIDPADGFLQRFVIEGDARNINFNFRRREEGEPFRVIAILRFQNKITRFSVSGPAGDSGQFGRNVVMEYDPDARNRNPMYSPSQQAADGHYAAVLMASYGSTNGAYIQVFSDNDEDTTVEGGDTLTGKAI